MITLTPDQASDNNARGSVRGLSNRAIAAIGKKNFSEAAGYFDHILAQAPTNTTALYYRATCRAEMGDADGALADTERALALEPRYVEVLALRAMIFWRLKRNDEALAAAQNTLDISPDSEPARAARSLVRSELGDAQGAMEDIDYLMKLHRNEPMLLNNRAVILNKLGRQEEALDTIEKVLRKLKQPSANVISTRAEIKREMRDYAGALADHAEALRIQPSSGSIYEERAKTYEAMGDLENAAKDRAFVAQLWQVNPTSQVAAPPPPQVKMNRWRSTMPIWLPIVIGVLVVIVPFVSSLLSGYSRFTGDVNGIMRTYEATMDAEIAKQSTLIAINPNDAKALYRRASNFQFRKLYARAVEDLTAYLVIAPNDVAGYMMRAACYEALFQQDKAVADYKKVLELSPAYDDDEGYIKKIIEDYEGVK